jgi:alpha-glucosidase (family GH31 glycosyl hydrolase)
MKVWPELAAKNGTYGYVYLDWFHNSSRSVWAKGLKHLYTQMEFDGIWLDMNEITGFCNGQSTDSCFVRDRNSTPPNKTMKFRLNDNDNGTWFTHYQN